MKLVKILWISIGIVFLFWCYYFFISPYIFKKTIVVIPNISGMSEKEAIETLKNNKIKYNINYIPGDSDIALYTRPSDGMKIYTDFEVDLYISKVLPEAYPSFIGLLFDSNKDTIERFCKDNEISYEVEYVIDNTLVENQIISQSKDIDSKVIKGDVIRFKVAKTNNYFEMPNLVGLSVNDAIEVLRDYNFEITFVYYNAPILYDTIMYQEIEPGYVLKRNGKHTICLYVSKGMPNDINTIKIEDFCNILNEIEMNYDIIYVCSLNKDILIDIKYEVSDSKYILYVTK